MDLRARAREWLPPAVVSSLSTLMGRRLRFEAVRGGWVEAKARSAGYDHASILQRVQQATREVIAGRAAYERDSVLFHEPALRLEVLVPLLGAALRHGGRLDVIDFGGSLGTLYRQCRPLLPVADVRWQVVEQPAFVQAGAAEFSTRELSFHRSIDDLPAVDAPRVLLASSVLQYLEDPMQQCRAWSAAHVDAIVIDRTPLWRGPDHVLTVQRVPRHIYPGSYPCWVLSRERLLAALGEAWRVVAQPISPEGRFRARGGPQFEFEGLILERRP